jgi:hypothetical protein
MMKRFGVRPDLILLIILTVIVFLIWYPTIHLPYWWDSAGFVMQEAHANLASHLWSFPDFSSYAHPPLLVFILAVSWRIFGESLVVSHLVYLPFILGSIYGVYFLSVQVINDHVLGRAVGFCSSLLLLFTPIYTAQIGIIYLEIPTLFFVLLSCILFLRRRFVLYSIVASLMVLTREFTLIVVLLFFLLYIIELRGKSRKGKKLSEYGDAVLLLLPIFFLAAWFVFHWYNSGWLIIKPGVKLSEKHGLIDFLKQLYLTIKNIFFLQWRSIIFGIGLFSFLIGLHSSFRVQKKFINLSTTTSLFVLLPLAYTLLFSETEFLPRYAVIIFPFLYIGSLVLLLTILKKKKKIFTLFILGSLTLTSCFLFYSTWNLHRTVNSYYFVPLEDNLEYLDVISVGRDVSSFAESKYRNRIIYTSFPTNYMMSMPYQGYVHHGLQVKGCMNYDGNGGILIFNFFSPESVVCSDILRESKSSFIALFSKNGKSIAVFDIKANKVKRL